MGEKRKIEDDRGLKIYTVDAFSSKPFSGNPAAVCLVETEGLDEALMQNIAAEMNISETCFIRRLEHCSSFEKDSIFGLRWFTPTNEVPLCGHATLASAAVLFNIIGNMNTEIHFETKSGVLKAKKSGSKIQLDLPVTPATNVDMKKYEDLVKTLVGDLEVQDLDLTANGFPGLMIRLADKYNRKDLCGFTPDCSQLMKAENPDNVNGIIVTLKGSQGNGCVDNNGESYDFVSRYFAPWLGINEDPVTGAAHTVLGPYWSKQLDKKQLYAKQCSKRGGELWLDVREDGRLDVAGYATIVLEGSIKY